MTRNDTPGKTVRGITSPLLIARGEDDHLVSSASLADLAARVPLARVVHVPGAGHAALDDQPAACAAALNDFLGGSRPMSR